MGRITVADLRATLARTEKLLRNAGELGPDEVLYVSQEMAGTPWQVFVKRTHMVGPIAGHPVIGWFGESSWLGRTKADAQRDLRRTNAALIMHLKATGRPTE